ncbi:hypothetical protein C8F04DRAFT_1277073 [Mycena alexandri]|uniref:CxC2-like cysteine cluster KDZ transposase-associated domain-containing protein n=1 Tax=Mycena alexandri TaxID=1745969 RepID=A0AAD6S122_9AGAR|nr:hypothetical protein C8F04DRAFT_1277073 [Mycena alexandri]
MSRNLFRFKPPSRASVPGPSSRDYLIANADRAILISDDGIRQSKHLHNIVRKKRRVRVDAVSGSEVLVQAGNKRKRYASSEEPMSEFHEVAQLYLDETVRAHGLGYSTSSPCCALCKQAVGAEAERGSGRRRFFRCTDCGVFLQCLECCLARHNLAPLHTLEEWVDNSRWRRLTLKAIGVVYQLGHEGFECKFPDPLLRSLTVVHTNGIHQIQYRYCKCKRSDTCNNLQQLHRNHWFPATKTDPDTAVTSQVLDLYRLLNVVGNLNARDFITSLERLTDATHSTGMNWLPDTYKAFLRVSRQSAFLQRARRRARAHDPNGLQATKEGELTPNCWPCPHDGRNLPPGWRDVAKEYQYLYRLIVALDANFKLKNRIRKNEIDDPSLGPGWGSFVEPRRYKKHLRKYVAEKDISTCIAFAALTQKETRNTAGLRVSGVGGCVCARHECMRPNGLGDLQKGERYANMDYILVSALGDVDLKEYTVSYDIACQWRKNFKTRMEKLPKALQRDFDDVLVQCGLPVWHALAHEEECTNENNLSLLSGVGKSDGEGIERLWAILNGIAFQTKEMSLGNRADTVEDRLDAHNFLKNLGQGDALRRRLIVAIAERARQVDAFKEINKTISTEKRNEWQTQIDAFLEDRTLPNPYVMKKQNGPSEADIRAKLRAEEQAEAREGQAPLHATSATAFLTAGLQLEETQRKIRAGVAAKSQLTADRQSKEVYTPGSVRMLATEAERRADDTPAPAAERVRLWLPSELPQEERASGCKGNLVEMEARLRESQSTDSLSAIRLALHSKRHLISFRHGNIGGQVRMTRSHSIVDQLGIRVDALAAKYNDARRALLVLRGEGYAPHLRKLEKEDLRLEGEGGEHDTEADRSDRAAAKKLGSIGGRPLREVGKTSVLSWIWTARGALDSEEEDLHESLRIEWSRAKARKTRWEEEVDLLREEMRRVIRYLAWEVETWEARAAAAEMRADVTQEARSGLRGYALAQAALHRELSEHFRKEWSMNVNEATTDLTGDVTTDLRKRGLAGGVASSSYGWLQLTKDQIPHWDTIQNAPLRPFSSASGIEASVHATPMDGVEQGVTAQAGPSLGDVPKDSNAKAGDTPTALE